MEAQRQQHYNPESNQEAEGRTENYVFFWLTLYAMIIVLWPLLIYTEPFGYPTVHVASLSLSLSSMPSPPAISGNWSVTLSVKNPRRRHRFGWDHAQVMLFYRDEFVAGTFLERFSLAPRGNATLQTGTVMFSLEVGDRAAWAMGMDMEDDGVMEFEVVLLHHDDRWIYRLGWDDYDCNGLKVGFLSQNQSQVGFLLSGSQHDCT